MALACWGLYSFIKYEQGKKVALNLTAIYFIEIFKILKGKKNKKVIKAEPRDSDWSWQ